MKNLSVAALLVLTAFATISCRDTKTETTEETTEVIREIEVETTEPVEEEDAGILERVGTEVDKEVNEEVNEEIDKIGNDDGQ